MVVSYTAGSNGSASVTASPYGTFEFQDMFDGNSVTGSGRYRGGPVDVAAVGLSASSLYSVATLTANATYRNDGNTAMTLTPSASAPFAVNSNGCQSIAPSASCNIQYSLNLLSAGGSYTACPTIGNSTGSISSCATLTAFINSAVPDVPQYNVATSSAAQTVTRYNTGLASMSVGTPTVSGNFIAATNCGATLAAGASCIVNVTFSPQSAGSLSGALTIPNDGGTDTVWLYGTGLAANFTFNTTISSNVANYSVSAAAQLQDGTAVSR